MPADNAAAPSDTGNADSAGDSGHYTNGAEQGAQQAPSSSLDGVARTLGLPADVAKAIGVSGSAEAAGDEGSGEGDGETSNVERRTSNAELPEGEEQSGAEGEGEGDGEHDDVAGQQANGANPFNDPRVRDRLGKDTRQKTQLTTALQALGFNDAEIAKIKASKNPDEVVALLQARGGADGDKPAGERAQESAGDSGRYNGPAAAPGKGILGRITTEAELDQIARGAEIALEWCDKNPDGATVKDESGAERFVTPAEIQEYRRQQERIILAEPKRLLEIRQAVGQQQQLEGYFNQQAQQRFPWLADQEAPEYAEAQQLIAESPEVQAAMALPAFKQLPQRNLLLGVLITGLKHTPKNSAGDSGRYNAGGASVNPDLPPALHPDRFRHKPLAPHTAAPPTRAAAPKGQQRVAEAMNNVVEGTGSLADLIRAKRESSASTNRNGRSPVLT